MAKNDITHLEASFTNWRHDRDPGLTGIDDPFLFFCLENFLKPYDLNDEEILSGLTDGSNDFGVDAIYYLVDGELVTEETDQQRRSVSSVELLFFQVKNSKKGFRPQLVEDVSLLVEDYLDFASDITDDIEKKYSPDLLHSMKLFRTHYSDLAGQLPKFSVQFLYITKADNAKPNTAALAAAERLKKRVLDHFSSAHCETKFVSAQSLLRQIRVRPPKTFSLRISERLEADEGYVCLVNLHYFYKFIVDDSGGLRKRLFESNVRGWLQRTKVNKDIADSLNTPGPNFWLLNNGITIICRSAQTEGRMQLAMEDPQIVNGLQTSRAIYEHFSDANPQDDRTVLVRVIRTDDTAVYDQVVTATNNQNKMPPASLRAMEDRHRQIDDFFRQYGLYYDRRKGHYKDERRPVKKIVTPNELLQAVVALVLRRPDHARARPGTYWSDQRYKTVFKADRPLDVYLRCVQILRRVGEHLAKLNLDRTEVRNIKFYVGAVLVSKIAKRHHPDEQNIRSIDPESMAVKLLDESCDLVLDEFRQLGADDAVAKGKDLMDRLQSILDEEYA